MDGAKLAGEFGAVRCGGHGVDQDRVPIIFLGCVEYLAILLPWFNEDVLGHDEATQDKALKPVRDVEDIIVSFFFVHGGHDLV